MKYSKDFNGTLTDADVMKLAGISRNIYYRYKAELRATDTGIAKKDTKGKRIKKVTAIQGTTEESH